MVHYGYLKGFILVHFPWIPLWTSWVKELVPSLNKEGFFNHTVDAVAWLVHFKTQNIELIQKLNLVTGKDYEWNKREMTPKNSPLLDLIEHGISRPAHASECFSALVEELKEQSSQKKCKTMVLADGINSIYYFNTRRLRIKENRRKIISPTHITAFEAMENIMKPDWSGGVVIVTVDTLATGHDERESDLPRYLLKREGWELFDPFVPIEVHNYTSQEVQTTIDYYLERKWLGHPGCSTEEGRLELEYLCTKNPLTLMTICNSK